MVDIIQMVGGEDMEGDNRVGGISNRGEKRGGRREGGK